jgi:hypothetical protein
LNEGTVLTQEPLDDLILIDIESRFCGVIYLFTLSIQVAPDDPVVYDDSFPMLIYRHDDW